MKKTICIFIFMIACNILLAQTELIDTKSIQQNVTKSGIGLGSVIAVVTSWSRNKSILWAILHGIFSWLYVIYFAVTEQN